MLKRSRRLFEDACQVLPGGVSSPVRAFKAVGGTPVFIERGEGAFLIDVDGNRYIDYVLSYGPLLLGHSPQAVVDAIGEASRSGTSFGAPSEKETMLACLIMQHLPGLEMLRFVNSGTEACMSAIRLARAFTRRNKVIKCEGNYHGHADALLKQAGSGVATLGLQDSPGVPVRSIRDTLVVPFNDLHAMDRALCAHKGHVAAIIVEPVAGNMGVVPPVPGYLQGLRDLASAHGVLLIFDEVMTGFRVHPGGAQSLYRVQPDLTTLGKVIGGGLPVGAYGGRRDIMEMVAPQGPVYQAGTLSGNPLAMSAGIAMLQGLRKAWSAANEVAVQVAQGIRAVAGRQHIPVQVHQVGAMFSCFFTGEPVKDYRTARRCDTDRFGRVFHALIEQGVYLPPSQFEACFTSSAHGPDEVRRTIQAFDAVFAA